MQTDFACFAVPDGDGYRLQLQIDGLRCAACAFKVEQALRQHDGVEAHVAYATQRLNVTWSDKIGPKLGAQALEMANVFARDIEGLGYHVAPFDAEKVQKAGVAEDRFLMRCLAVAGFATGNIMLFSQAIWFNPHSDLTGASLDLMHWLMALIALPAAIYAGQPFFGSAVAALSKGRSNMDVPISIAIILTNGLSLFETLSHGHYVYFDASVMLLFFLLIGRVLDIKARGRAHEAAASLLALMEGTARIRNGSETVSVRIRDIRPGQTVLVATGEKIAVDSALITDHTEADTALVTGESLPRTFSKGETLYAGMINLGPAIELRALAASEDSLLSDIITLMEKAEQGQARYVRLADRVARLYAPAVHLLAAATFTGWLIVGHVHPGSITWEDALLKAMAVLIITCPCALGLAVPVVQVMASSILFRQGILLKSGKGLETLARIDTVVFDKTGTLTEGHPHWGNPEVLSDADLAVAVAMTASSRHPLSIAVATQGQAILQQKGLAVPQGLAVLEQAGLGLEATIDGVTLRLGRGTWVGGEDHTRDGRMSLWMSRGEAAPVRLCFEDMVRADAAEVIAALKAYGLKTIMLSGDHAVLAEALGRELGLDTVEAELSPVNKVQHIETLRAQGRRVAMVGDGLNDAAALSAAFVSLSPSTGIDITQNAADIVYRGKLLAPVLRAFETAQATGRLVKQNFALSILYNVLAIPAAMVGLVTPLIAALAMSGSSLMVIGNAFRLKGMVSRRKL